MEQGKNFKHYNSPTRYDKAPQGTIWESSKDDSSTNQSVQVNENSEEPQWETMGNFLEKALDDLIHDQGYIKSCIMLFKEQEERRKKETI